MAFWRKKSESRALTRENLPAVLFGGGSGQPVSVTSALRIADVFACIRLLAESASILPLHTYRRRGARRERIETSTTRLLAAPAPAITTSGLIGQAVTQLASWGSCFVGKWRRDDAIFQLGLLDPSRMEVAIRGGRPVYTYHGIDGQPDQRLTVDDVVHVRLPMSLDGINGLTPIGQARTAHQLSRSLVEHGESVMRYQAVPAGVLKVGDAYDADDDEIRALRDAWTGEHQGKPGRVAVLAGEVDFVPITLPLGDLLFVEQRQLSTLEIARLYRIPAHFINAHSGESQHYSNTESIAIELATFTLQPYLVALEQALSRDEDLFGRDEFCAFKLDALLRADSKTRAEVFALALDPERGWMDRDEVRALEDLD